MSPRTKFYYASKNILHFFERSGRRVFSKSDLSNILAENISEWNLPINYTTRKFISDLLDFLPFKEVFLGDTNLFVYKDAEEFDLFFNIKKSVFYTHYSALRFHSLTEQTPFFIYLSKSRKNVASSDVITQDKIDEAFSKVKVGGEKFLEYGKYKIFLKTVVCSDVDIQTIFFSVNDGYSYSVRVTNLEKTLIDAVINPDYCGGPGEVLKAFERARDKVSAIKIKTTLNRLGYKYPYHQLIGFYMERADYDSKKIKIIEDMGISFDFYLAHGCNDFYSERWRIHYPNAL